MTRNTIRQWRTCRRGASAVEFAIIAPVMLLLLLGILSYGAYLTVIHSIQQLAAEAARAAVAGLSDTERETLANNAINISIGAYPLIVPQRLSVTKAATEANVFSVTLTYDASNMFIYDLPKFIPAPPPTIIRSASISRGGF